MPDAGWYPHNAAAERLMYGNVEGKIDGYAAKYPFLTEDYLQTIHAMCQTFVEAYDKIEYNRTTGKQAMKWFENLMSDAPQGEDAPAPPIYMTITLPSEAFIGIEKSFREFAGLFKKQLNYDKADGLDLMIEREKHKRRNTWEIYSLLNISATTDK